MSRFVKALICTIAVSAALASAAQAGKVKEQYLQAPLAYAQLASASCTSKNEQLVKLLLQDALTASGLPGAPSIELGRAYCDAFTSVIKLENIFISSLMAEAAKPDYQRPMPRLGPYGGGKVVSIPNQDKLGNFEIQD
jgi:hypothetical protein